MQNHDKIISLDYELGMLPPLTALRSFEAVARLGKVSLAAAELGISQPAVSAQIKLLERHLGVQLISKAGRGIELTAAGRAYADGVVQAFAGLRQATAGLASGAATGQVRIGLMPTLAQVWLVPRLAQAEHELPGIDIVIEKGPPAGEWEAPAIDITIRYGGPMPWEQGQLLIEDRCGPVLSPARLAESPVHKPADLALHPWISVNGDGREEDWVRWCRAADVADLTPPKWLTVPNSGAALAAARHGLGVAMAPVIFAEEELAAGRLIAPLPQKAFSGGSYWVCTRRRPRPHPATIRVRDWLLAQGAKGPAPLRGVT